MLNKKHNPILTLTILLTLVGISKPAKASLLAQSDAPEITFTVPDELPDNTTVQIASPNSSSIINEGLEENFTTKYPNAEVNVETINSNNALSDILDGETDLVAIGRNLTSEEKSQGLTAVPISREKIAIVISKNNPYEGNLTISQFAQLFRGEIADWSQIGGESREIKLVDLPESNHTRQAFPSYSVFKEGEFATGSNATQLDEDNTEAMIAQLGDNGIGYAVAGDVIDRDDVKVLTMHQTQPDDLRYPFSQPFNLVYKGEPNEATEAFLGYAITEEGQQTIAKRVGLISAIQAAAIASRLENKLPGTTSDTVASQETTDANLEDTDEVAQTDLDESGELNSDLDGSGALNSDLDGSGALNSDLDGSGEVTPGVDGRGELNSEFQDSGEVNTDIEDSGEPNSEANLEIDDAEAVVADAEKVADEEVVSEAGANLNADAEADANLDGDRETDTAADEEVVSEARANLNADAETDLVVPVDADTDNGEGEAAIAEENNNGLFWWIPLIIGIPLLGLIAYKFAGGKERSDREPALANVPVDNNLQGGTDGTFELNFDGGDTRVGTAVGTVALDEVETDFAESNEIPTGEAAIAGGAVAADNLSNEVVIVSDSEQDVDPDLVELENIVAQPETDIDAPIEPIPYSSVGEVTGQETKLQLTDQPTKLQTDAVDDSEDISSLIGGAAAVGGTGLAAGYLSDQEDIDSVEEIEETSVTDNEAYMQSVYVSEQPTIFPTDDLEEENIELGADDITFDTIDSQTYVDSEEVSEQPTTLQNDLEEENIELGANDITFDTIDSQTYVDSEEVSEQPTTLQNDLEEENIELGANDITFDTIDSQTYVDSEEVSEQPTTLQNDLEEENIELGADDITFDTIDSQTYVDSEEVSEQPTTLQNDLEEENVSGVEDKNIELGVDDNTFDTTETTTEFGDDYVLYEEGESDSFNEGAITSEETITFDAVETPEIELLDRQETVIEEESDSTDNLTPSAAIATGAAASGFFTDGDSEEVTETDSPEATQTTTDDLNWVDDSSEEAITSEETITFDAVETPEIELLDRQETIIDGEISYSDDETQTSDQALSSFFPEDDSPEASQTTTDELNWVDSFNDEAIISEETITFDAVETPEAELLDRQETVIEEESDSTDNLTPSAEIATGAAALGGLAAASGFFTDGDSEEVTETDSQEATQTTTDDLNWVDSFNDEVTTPEETIIDGEMSSPDDETQTGDRALSSFFSEDDSPEATQTTTDELNWFDAVETPEAELLDRQETIIDGEISSPDDETQTGDEALSSFFSEDDSPEASQTTTDELNWVDDSSDEVATSEEIIIDGEMSSPDDETQTGDEALSSFFSEDDSPEETQTTTDEFNWVDDSSDEVATSEEIIIDGEISSPDDETQTGDEALSSFFSEDDSPEETQTTTDDLDWVDDSSEEVTTPEETITFHTGETSEVSVSDSSETVMGETSGSVDNTNEFANFLPDFDSEQTTETDSVETNTATDDLDWIDGFNDEVTTLEETIVVDTVETPDSVETDTATDEFNWIDSFNNEITTLDETNASLEDITFNEATDSTEINLEDITFDDNDETNASLEDITFNEATDSTEINLEDITFDDNDETNASLEDITFNEANDSTEINLEDITFDDNNNDSIDNLIESINVNTFNKPEISLDNLGFETRNQNDASFDSMSSKTTAKAADLKDDRSNDMNNISEWLDSLETPNQKTDNISEWLDNLSADHNDLTMDNSDRDNKIESKDESEEISFQFLEDLLERDFNANQDSK